MKIIHRDYSAYKNSLQPVEQFISGVIKQGPNVHAVKSRVKDSDHLVEKIIRHSVEKGDAWVKPSNYRKKVTDLIGVRALHLFKEEWESIHDYICDKLNVIWKPKPIIYIRKDDPNTLMQQYKKKSCKIVIQESGYTSAHYLIDFKSNDDNKYIAEVQVRTLFEDAWSEISHKIRYPYNVDDPHVKIFTSSTSHYAAQLNEASSIARLFQIKAEIEKENIRGRKKRK